MRRTQLYLDDGALSRKTTVSHLVREAVRESYTGGQERQRAAMLAFAGSRTKGGLVEEEDATEYIRKLRQGDRLERLQAR